MYIYSIVVTVELSLKLKYARLKIICYVTVSIYVHCNLNRAVHNVHIACPTVLARLGTKAKWFGLTRNLAIYILVGKEAKRKKPPLSQGSSIASLCLITLISPVCTHKTCKTHKRGVHYYLSQHPTCTGQGRPPRSVITPMALPLRPPPPQGLDATRYFKGGFSPSSCISYLGHTISKGCFRLPVSCKIKFHIMIFFILKILSNFFAFTHKFLLNNYSNKGNIQILYVIQHVNGIEAQQRGLIRVNIFPSVTGNGGKTFCHLSKKQLKIELAN